MTALSIAANSTASTTLSTANTLANTLATSTQAHPTTLVSTATGWGEVYAQGNASAWAAAGSQPAPSGHGWLWDVTTLEGQQISAGNWTPTLKLRISSGTLVATIVARAYVYHSGGTYTQIGIVTYVAQTLGTSTGTLTGTATAFLATPFATGDKLYIDVVMNVTTPAAAAVTVSAFQSNVANQGDATTIGWVTPGYLNAIVSGTATMVSNSTLTQAAIIIASGVPMVATTALNATAQVASNVIMQSNSTISQAGASVLALASLAGNSAISQAATITAYGLPVVANATMQAPAQVVGSATLQSNSAMSEVAQVVALAQALIANAVLSATGVALQAEYGTAFLADTALNSALLADTALNSTTITDTVLNSALLADT